MWLVYAYTVYKPTVHLLDYGAYHMHKKILQMHISMHTKKLTSSCLARRYDLRLARFCLPSTAIGTAGTLVDALCVVLFFPPIFFFGLSFFLLLPFCCLLLLLPLFLDDFFAAVDLARAAAAFALLDVACGCCVAVMIRLVVLGGW